MHLIVRGLFVRMQAMKSMNRLRCAGTAILLALGGVIPVDAQVSTSSLVPPVPCEVGSYLMADGTSLDIAAAAPGQLRWRRLDGRTGALTPQGKGRWTSTLGWTDRSDGHHVTISDCKRGEIRFDDVAGRREPLAGSPETLRKEGPSLLEGLPAHYDPMPVLANLEVPQLWILGGQDRDAPPGETIRRLAALRNAGRPITTAVFPDADHGMYEFETLPDGERVSTRQPEGYFSMMGDFIKGKHQASSYGSAEISSRGSSPPDRRLPTDLLQPPAGAGRSAEPGQPPH